MNDGSAFPFVMLGMGLLGLHELGEFGLRWGGWSMCCGPRRRESPSESCLAPHWPILDGNCAGILPGIN